MADIVEELHALVAAYQEAFVAGGTEAVEALLDERSLNQAAEYRNAAGASMKRLFSQAERSLPSADDSTELVLAREVLRLREILAAYEQEADLNDESTQDLVDIINKLEAQVEELLPWAKSGALKHKDGHDDIVAIVEIDWVPRLLHPSKARELLDRINAGEFGEARRG